MGINNVDINKLPEWFSQISRFAENEARVTKLTGDPFNSLYPVSFILINYQLRLCDN